MRTATIVLLSGGLLLSSLTAPSDAADIGIACPSTRVPPIVLPHMRDAIASNKEVTIVALGSSSTEGWRASDLAHSYPAELQADLTAALPTAHVAVINRGIGGEDVAEELPRMEADALAIRPALVIWQVGANGAMRNTPLEQFKQKLAAGIKRLQASNVDVVLMDNQKAPAILASPEHIQIDQAMAEVSVNTGARLFARGALMDQWREAGYPYEKFISDDGVHHNDYGYRCMTAALSNAIIEGLKQAVPTTQTAAKR